MDNEQLQSDINERNFYNFENKCKVLYSYKSGEKKQSAIIKVLGIIQACTQQ